MSASVFSTLSGILTGKHPELGILCRETGEVLVPKSGSHKAHWTFGHNRKDGYRIVYIDGKGFLVHRLAVETFIGSIPEGYQIDHINRCRSDNRVGIDGNLRIVTPSENRRNTADHDRVTEQGRTHKYEDARQFDRDHKARYRAENKDKIRKQSARYYVANKEKIDEQQSRYSQAKRKTCRRVKFADGSRHWLPLAEADAYLAIPLKERIYGK